MGEYPDQLIVCEHHVSDALECDFSWERVNLYGVQYIPHVFFDGVYDQLGAGTCEGAADTYRNIIEARLAETNGLSPVSISGGYYLEGETMHIEATFELVDPVALESPRAFVAITEDGIVLADTYDHVTRWGTHQDVVLSQAGDQAQVTTTATVPTEWNPNELKVVAWLQSAAATPEVYQTAFLPPTDPAHADDAPVLAVGHHLLAVSPNPMPVSGMGIAQPTVRLVLSSAAAAQDLRLDLLDTAGRVVREIYHGRLTSGDHRLTWDGRGQNGATLASGAYFMRLATAEDTRAMRLVVVR